MGGIIINLVQRRIRNKKDFFEIYFHKEILRFKFLCEHGICGSFLFTFREIFVRINNFSIKVLIQNYLSRYKMHQFGVPNRRKAIEKTSSGLIGKFTIKKNFKFNLRTVFLRKYFILFLFF